MPLWWTDGVKGIIGYTDGIETHCCSLSTSVFVRVPEYDYSGYFFSKDLKEVIL
jgi:hypothetical protein